MMLFNVNLALSSGSEEVPMTTGLQPESGGDLVPRYFVDFMEENARQHAELAAGTAAARAELAAGTAAARAELAAGTAATRAELGASIAEVRGELRIIKALAFALTGTALVALSKYVIGW